MNTVIPLSSPDTFFQPNPAADADDAYNVVSALLEQASGTIQALMADYEEGRFGMCPRLASAVMWSLQSQIELAIKAHEYKPKQAGVKP